MKILSFQHKSVLDKILSTGEYKCDYISRTHKSSPLIYNKLRTDMNKQLKEKCINPIFGWYRVIDDEIVFNDETINRALQMVSFDHNNYIALLLEIPESYVLLTDFYEFADMRLFEEEHPTAVIELSYKIYDDEVQATFPVIKKEWLKKAYTIETKLEPNKYFHNLQNVYYLDKQIF